MEVIRVENVSKLYRLGEVGTGTLSHDLNRWWAKMRGKEDPYAKVARVNDRAAKGEGKHDYVWALQDIDFSVQQGEVLGVIGRNGAGKSTLLKIISRITAPTKGDIKIKGRIGSLLEVGTGFHPEMTGRENIFMNGTLLGMRRKEIQAKLDDIVDFAGVALYLDTPVKRYSSGMMVRLGFAVAAFLEPEILIVDEVLAVGDAEFQKKALGRMKEVSKNDGRTVLFVTHNMASIQALCTSGMVLKNGRVEIVSDVTSAVHTYLTGSFELNSYQSWDSLSGPGNENIRLSSLIVKPLDSEIGTPIYVHDNFTIEIEFWNIRDNHNVDITLRFFSDHDILLFVTGSTTDNRWHGKKFPKGKFSSLVMVPGHLLNSGKYRVEILFGHGGRILLCKLDDLLSFEILHSTVGREYNMNVAPGLFRPQFRWETNLLEESVS